LPGGRREQEKWQDKQQAGDIRELALVHAEHQDALESHKYDEPVAKYIVVERAEKLGAEKGREAALTEQ
jgi:hypothetical protein